jgi:16S rRNA (cytosine1402-N4)-methyltransferase
MQGFALQVESPKSIKSKVKDAKCLELSKGRSLSERAEIVRAEGWPVLRDRPEGEPGTILLNRVRFREASSAGLEKVAKHEVSKEFIYLDGTLGGAGHALAMAEALKGKLTIIGLDRDPQAIERAKETLKDKAEIVILETEDFRNLDKVLATHKITKVDRILFDLGLSSDEIEKSGLGFSFKKNEPLLMTFGDPATYPFTACDIVNGWKEEDIANVIYAYGEERYARRIAKSIVVHREKKAIETSSQLAEIVRSSVPSSYRHGKIHPATRTFQALRIAVNDELAALREGLAKAWNALGGKGRLAVISFHSLEDRIVKEFFKEKAKMKVGKLTEGIIINKRPITASIQEISENPRSRSAKLRIIEKVYNY